MLVMVMVRSLWLGAVVGATMKLASPHRNPLSWVLAGCVGALGGLAGVYAARFVGLSSLRPSSFYLAIAIAAAGVVLVYAGASRWAHRRLAARGRATRSTMIF
jgi:hypothetical protein